MEKPGVERPIITGARVERLASGGRGIIRRAGKVYFTPWTAPGDIINAAIVAEKKNYGVAELLEITTPSPVRVAPVCPFYQKCGGCSLQHIAYEAQLEEKKLMLRELMKRVGGVETDITAVPSSPFGYRNRMRFHRVEGGAGRAGLKEGGSGKVVALDDCPVAHEGIRKALREGAFSEGAFSESRLSPPPGRESFTVYSGYGVFLREGAFSEGAFYKGAGPREKERAAIRLLDKELVIDVRLFFQSNAEALEKLIPDIIDAAKEAGPALPAADVFSGVGTFAVFLRELFPRVDLIEENPAALELARVNTGTENARFFNLRDSAWAAGRNGTAPYGFMVLDPPRQGLSPAFSAWLSRSGPPSLAYVSCDPATFARDSRILLGGLYGLDSLRLYDFYPGTSHIECMGVFRKMRKS